MSLNTDRESHYGLLFTHDLYVNPYDEHKNHSNIKIRLAIVLIIMLFFSLLILSVVVLIRTTPIEQPDSLTTFSTNK